MPVTLFSKIKIRRGTKDELVDLDKAEFGFVTDTGELMIGAPDYPPLQGKGKGEPNEEYPYKNLRILTNSSNQTNTITYTYEGNSSHIAQTGPTSTEPVLRNAQERFDDLVFFDNFISTNLSSDKTSDLNRMLRQVYNNTDTRDRKICHISSGTYYIEGSIKLPPYTHLKGEGIDRTFLTFRTTTSQTHMFETVDKLFQEGTAITTNSGGAPHDITISDMTITIDQLMDFFRIYRANKIKFIRVKFKGAGAVSSTSAVFNLSRLGIIIDMSDFRIEDCVFEDVSRVFNELNVPANTVTDIYLKNSSFNFVYNIFTIGNPNIKNIKIESCVVRNAQSSPFVFTNGSNYSSNNNFYLLDNLVQPNYTFMIGNGVVNFSSVNDEITSPLKINNSSNSSVIITKNSEAMFYKNGTYSQVLNRQILANQSDIPLNIFFPINKFETVFIDYSLKMGSTIRTGRLTLTHNSIVPTIFDNYNETDSSEVLFSVNLVPLNGTNNLSLIYESGSKSGNMTLTYIGHGK